MAPNTRKKLLTYFEDGQKKQHLLLETAIVVDIGVHFVKGTYALEGDEALALTCFDRISTIISSVNQAFYPNTQAIIRTLSSKLTIQKQLLDYGIRCVAPGLDYFQSCLNGCLNEPLLAFKAIRLFNPSKVHEIQPQVSDIDKLSVLPFLVSTIPQLKEEFSAYVAAAEDTDPSQTREFWVNHKDQLPTWCSSYQKVVLVQPSSAASERVF